MEVNVRLGPGLSERAGVTRLTVTLPSDATVRDLLAHLKNTYPEQVSGLATALPVVRGSYVSERHKLVSGEEVSLLMPVSGG
jgi:molybdopterin converting factor small subunit